MYVLVYLYICMHACIHSYIPAIHTRVTVVQLQFIHILWFSINCCTYFSWRILKMLHGEFFSNTKLGGKSIFTNNNNMMGFLCGLAGKESTCNVGDLGLIPELGRSPGEGKGYPLQYSGLENSKDCIVHGVTKSRTRLSDFHFHNNMIW